MQHRTLTTERLTLVPVSMSHVEDIFANFNEKVTKFMSPCPAKDISETKKVVENFLILASEGKEFHFAITKKETGEFLGLCGIHGLLGIEPPELGIWTKVSAHGNHFGREAVGALISLAKELGFEKVKYPVDERNTPSWKIPSFYGGVQTLERSEFITSDGRTLFLVEFEIKT